MSVYLAYPVSVRQIYDQRVLSMQLLMRSLALLLTAVLSVRLSVCQSHS